MTPKHLTPTTAPMKMSLLFGQTLRDAPADTSAKLGAGAEVASHQLLIRAGFIRPLGPGMFAFLPLARRSLSKIETILREEMDKLGGQEVDLPFVHPAELWQASGRWYQFGPELTRFQDRNGHDLALATAYHEVIADLARREVQSYKQLPRLVYHLAALWRDKERPRGGLLRMRAFPMFSSYSLDADRDGLERQYRAHYQACFNIFRRCGLDVIAVQSASGTMDGKPAHEFMYLTPIGEDTLLLCDACGYTANRQVARFRKPPAAPEEPRPIEKVKTPACKTIEDLANFLGVPKAKTAKAVFFMATIPDGETVTEQFVFAVIRGDMDLNETKLANAIGARDLRPATEEEIRRVGAEPGFASPVGLRVEESNSLIVVDDSIASSPNLVAGANQADYHLLNTNFGRDYQTDLVTDLAAAEEGAACPQCSAPLRAERGVEVGHLSQPGTRYSEALGCTFLDRDGQPKPVVMGSYGIGVGRLLACIAEAHHDEHGLVWPVSVAPFQVHLVLLRGKGTPQAEETAERLYAELQAAGIEVLYDDRDESPGVKFNDADLIGCPLRLTVSERALGQGGVEMKLRREQEKVIVPLAETPGRVQAVIQSLHAELTARPMTDN
ncbi:MAG: proline--tRNA ligase [Anaerolineales bacterium]